MSDLPISFSAPMVRALLREIRNPGSGKTQTRRPLKTPVGFDEFTGFTKGRKRAVFDCYPPICAPAEVAIRYAVGDRLYVREHWRTMIMLDKIPPRDLNPRPDFLTYEADSDRAPAPGRHRQAMHMPRWASRITLLVREVRVERLQDCSEADARAEGAIWHDGRGIGHSGWRHDENDGTVFSNCRSSFQRLWDNINGPGAWALNPWVAAYSFRPVLGNIDTMEAPHDH